MRKAVTHLRQADPVLAALIERVGPFKPQYAEPTFRALARSIVFQQLHARAASTIYALLEAGCGEEGVPPAALARLRLPKLRTFGLSAQKSAYLKDFSERTAGGELDFAALPALPDRDVIAVLTRVKGVGVWTAHMFLLFALRRPDILPVGDYAIRAAMQKAFELPGLPRPPEIEHIAAPWRPWASVASWYLWRSLDGPAAP
ncbi:MAG: DNA-3-methyladenine glycosylase 2 family protein [Acidobacteria bacterium]|nr:DNA-3-methyladenine glycosylase 2 family protein [Acidobacteriota bacterium]